MTTATRVKNRNISHSVAIAIVERMSRTEGRYEPLTRRQRHAVAALVRRDRRGKLTLTDVIARLTAISHMGAGR